MARLITQPTKILQPITMTTPQRDVFFHKEKY